MNVLKRFEIPFSGLSDGIHYFDFEINNVFFEALEYSEIKKGKLVVGVTMEKQSTHLILDFSIKGTVNVMCDRCTDYFDLPIEGEERLVVRFGHERGEETDQIIVIPEADGEINIAHFIYEYISIFIPIKRVHPEDEKGKTACNKQMIKKLDELKQKTIQATDPRWDALKKLN